MCTVTRSKLPKGFYPEACCSGVTPYCAPGISKYANCVMNDGTGCNSCSSSFIGKKIDEGNDLCTFNEWKEVGYVYCTEILPITVYATKQCARCDVNPFLGGQFGECTGCRDQDSVYLEDKFHHQRRASAFERPTIFSNNGVGIGAYQNLLDGKLFNSNQVQQLETNPLGWNHGVLNTTGCKCNRCNQDTFYHPMTSVKMPNVSRYYSLFARRPLNPQACLRLQFAVSPQGRGPAPLIILPNDPRQPIGTCNGNVGYRDQAFIELKSGDQIYIPGESLRFNVHFWADDAGPYRQNHSVFRGYSPVKKQMDQVQKHYANSGLRNFASVSDPRSF